MLYHRNGEQPIDRMFCCPRCWKPIQVGPWNRIDDTIERDDHTVTRMTCTLCGDYFAIFDYGDGTYYISHEAHWRERRVRWIMSIETSYQ